ncbi:TauD/TfdA family dioxygenase [Alicyclobacillus tolerans]|uniref:TauD/TfdA family dioxygenase n=1 Tax=Alicyclobacillus tolerans TaxID=90970 RepID=UPI003B7A4BE2
MQVDPGFVIELSESEREHVRNLSNSVGSMEQVNDELLNRIEVVSLQLPHRVVSNLIAFKRSSNNYGMLLLRGLPIDVQLPLTPTTAQIGTVPDITTSKIVLLLHMLLIGEPIGYEDEQNGELFHHVYPIKGCEHRIENSGSKVFFDYHTEDAIHPFRPDHLALLCLRNDHDETAETRVSCISKALQVISPHAINILRKNLFELKAPSSFGKPLSIRTPVLTESLLLPRVLFDYATMKGVTEEAQWALEQLNRAFNECSISVKLKPGDLAIIDNRIATHARTTFEPRYDGRDRWLLRLYTVVDAFASRQVRWNHEHICAPISITLTSSTLNSIQLSET